MSKIGNAILLLAYLQNGKKYSISELAGKLEVSERMVRTYRDLLEQAGFYIETIRGPYGGYIIPKQVNIPEPHWKETDLEILKKVEKNIEDQQLQSELQIMIQKMQIGIVEKQNIILEEDKKLYNLFSKACKEHLKVKIIYNSKGKGDNERTIRPYELFFGQNRWGVAAYCEMKQDLRHFDLSRIKRAVLLDEKF